MDTILENKKWCADCKNYLTLDKFYPSSIKLNNCYCKIHQNERSNKYQKKYNYSYQRKYQKTEKGNLAIKKVYKDHGLQLKSKRIWNGTNTEYDLSDFLNDKQIVYFIGDTNGIYVKIGITSSIFSLSHRFRAIQGCNPMPLKLLGFIQTNNARKLEKQLHQQFKTHNRIGEWHILAPEINRYIKENCMHIELANTMIGETYLSLPSLLADDMGY